MLNSQNSSPNPLLGPQVRTPETSGFLAPPQEKFLASLGFVMQNWGRILQHLHDKGRIKVRRQHPGWGHCLSSNEKL